MHAIFRVNELLLEIFTHVGNAGRGGKGDLAALARTCKAFSYAALGQLWNDMSGMVKLLSLFPIIRKRRGTSALSEITFDPERPLSRQHWDRFSFYANMVRRLVYCDNDEISSTLKLELALSRPANLPCLLPNLQSLDWSFLSQSSPILPLLISPNLSKLCMHGGYSGSRAAQYHSNVSRALSLCGRLRSLSLRFVTWGDHEVSPGFRDAEQALINYLCQAPEIEDLEFHAEVYLSSSTIHQLSLLPRLVSLHLSSSNPIPMSFVEPVPQARFPSLAHLNLSVPISMAMDFARFNSSLSSFRLCLRPCTLADLEKWLMGSNTCFGRSLRDFYIFGGFKFEEGFWDGSGLLAFVSGIALTRLVVDVPVDIDNQTLEDLGLALPYLEQFEVRLCEFPSPKATIWGVLRLLAGCSRMKTLAIQFNAIVEEENRRPYALPKSNLTKLSVGLSPIDDVALTAELFGEVFPRLESLESITDEGAEEEDESGVAAKWRLVWDMQRVFQRMYKRWHSEVAGES